MKKISALLLTLTMIPTSYALNLSGENGVNILAINGKKVKTNFFTKEKIDIEAGKYQIVVRYSAQFNNDGLIESRPSIFTIDIEQDTKISIKRINSYQQAERQINKGFTWNIITEDKQYQITDSDTLIGQGFMPYSDIEKLVIDYNQQHNSKLVEKTVDTIPSSVTKKDVSTQQNSLISLYQQASKEEKKAFRLWLLEQDMK